jgi:hypothetical protein
MLKEMGKIAGADSCAAKKVRISIGVHTAITLRRAGSGSIGFDTATHTVPKLRAPRGKFIVPEDKAA